MIQDAVYLGAKLGNHSLTLDQNGAAAAVGAGGHQRYGASLQQQLMQRGVGQHDAEIGDAGGYAFGEGNCAGIGCPLSQQGDGSWLGAQQIPLILAALHMQLGFVEGSHHHRQRLAGAAFKLAQPRYH
ncbi:hypothetical protein D3C85_1532720 [compost metagenome]